MSKFTLIFVFLLTALNACNYNSIDPDELDIENIKGNLKADIESCNSSDPINSLDWLNEMIEENPTSSCSIIESVQKGNYKGNIIFMPYFIMITEKWICCGCGGVIAYDCQGELVGEPCSNDIAYSEITDIEEVYRISDEVLAKKIAYADSLESNF